VVLGLEVHTASDNTAEAAEGVGDTRPRVPFGGERARMSIGRNNRPVPRLLVLAKQLRV
jgi:hypothetical protein